MIRPDILPERQKYPNKVQASSTCQYFNIEEKRKNLGTKYISRQDDSREQLEQEVNAALDKSDKAVETLAKQFPSPEDIVSQHDNAEEPSISPALGEWIDQSDHIQKKSEEDLLALREGLQ